MTDRKIYYLQKDGDVRWLYPVGEYVIKVYPRHDKILAVKYNSDKDTTSIKLEKPEKTTRRPNNMKTIAEKAQYYRSFFERKEVPTDRNKAGFIWINKDHDNEEVKDLCFTAHNKGGMLPDDFIYSRIVEALDCLSEREPETENDAQERLYELEADIYTSDLTAWLNSSNTRVYYLTQALEEFECKDGFQALAIAQKLEIDEISNAVLDYILSNLDEEEETEE
jgi:hypothetical protein